MFDKTKRYTFYALVILDTGDQIENYGDQAFVDLLSGFTENKWVFREYISRYSKLIDATTSLTVTYNDITYDEFVECLLKDTKYALKESDYIYSLETVWGDLLVFNDNMVEQLYDYNGGYDVLEEVFQVSYSECYMLFNEYRIYFKESFDIVFKMINRIWMYLTALRYFMEVGYMNEGESDLLKLLNESLKFPNKLESMEYPDVYDENYMLEYILDSCTTLV